MGKKSKHEKASSSRNVDLDTDTDTSIEPAPLKKNKKKVGAETDIDDYNDTNRLERKPSPVVAPLPTLTKEEYEIFEKVSSGAVEDVKGIIGKMNINKTNKFGYTVLHLAVRRQDEAMTQFLLEQPGIQLYDTILHSVREGNKEITKMLLTVHDKEESHDKKKLFVSSLGGNVSKDDLEAAVSTAGVHPVSSPISMKSGVKSSIRKDPRPRFGSTGKSNVPSSAVPVGKSGGDGEEIPFDSEFPPVITPLMLAAQMGSYTLMELFYSRNERLEAPEFHHNLGCECDICAKLEGDQDITRTHQRYQLFKSICQPEYICFMARKEKMDPVNYTIDKILKVRGFCKRDTAYDRMYEDFIVQLETFLVDLIGLCRNTLETEIFLSPKDSTENELLPHKYPRLWHAVGLELKQFVAHPNVQNIVYKIWATDDWPEWDTFNDSFRLFNLLIRIVCFPIIALILFFAENTTIGRKLGSPVSRFLTYVGSYTFFLILVGFQIFFPYQRCNDEYPYYQVEDIDCKQRGPPNIGTEWPIVIYVLSFFLSTIKRNSISWYWLSAWNWLEFACHLSFVATFVSWLWAWVWTQLPENQDLISVTERIMWPNDCAEVFGECFLSIATMLAFTRLLRFLQLHPAVGAIQIGMGKQVIAFFGSVLMYVAVLLSFASGLLAVYVPYKDFKGYDDDNKLKTQDGTFTDIFATMNNLFWFLYGNAGRDPATLLTWNANNSTDGEENIHHDYNEYTGVSLYVIYHVVGKMMMFEMLSGYFAQTFNDIQDDVEVHWKFAKTELYLTFVKDTVLPPPFNLIPSIASMGRGATFMSLLGKKEDPKSGCSCRHCCYITESQKRNRWSKLMKGYRKLILELMYRYMGKDEGGAAATKDDILEIGEELAEMKSILMSIKGGSGSGSSSDDDDDVNYPTTGGVSVAKSSKKGWGKAKSIIDRSGPIYLKNVVSKGAISGAGSAVTSQPRGAGIVNTATNSGNDAVPSQRQSMSSSRKLSSQKEVSGITTVFPPQQLPPKVSNVPQAPNKSQYFTPKQSSTKTTSGATKVSSSTHKSSSKHVPQAAPSKVKSAPIEKVNTTIHSGKSAPALQSTPARSKSKLGELPKPISPKAMTTTDGETTDGAGALAPVKSSQLLRSLSKMKPGS